MEDNLKALQKIQTYIISFIIALSIPLLSNDSIVYEEALDELKIIESMPFYDIDNDSKTWIEWKPLKNDLREISFVVANRIRKFEEEYEYYEMFDNELAKKKELQDSIRINVNSPPVNFTLSKIREYIQNNPELKFVSINHWEIDSLINDYYDKLNLSKDNRSYDSWFDEFDIHFNSKNNQYFIVYRDCQIQGGSQCKETEITIPEEYISFEEPINIVDLGKEWINVRGFGDINNVVINFNDIVPNEIINIGVNSKIIFPKLNPIWLTIKDLDIKSAEIFIKQKIIEKKGTINVFGLVINGKLLVFFAPIILLVLLLYYYFHIVHFVKLKTNKEDILFLKKYPWLPIFQGVFPFITSSIIIFYLPVFEVGFLILISTKILSLYSVILLFFILIITAITSTIIIKKLIKLRTLIN